MNPRQLHTIGYSVEGRPIELWSDPQGPNGTLIIGGVHGDESAAINLVREFTPPRSNPVALLPLANPDGFARASRYNARGVDINRNAGFDWRADSAEPAGDAPWSEPETRALQQFILNWRPAKIIALHWALGEIDADGVQSTTLAEAMWNALSETERMPYRLRVTEEERRRLQQTEAECPGSLGRWAGYGLIYPDGSQPAMITLELPYDASIPRAESLPDDHVDVVQTHWARDPHSYLATVRDPVFKMLKAACELKLDQVGEGYGAASWLDPANKRLPSAVVTERAFEFVLPSRAREPRTVTTSPCFSEFRAGAGFSLTRVVPTASQYSIVEAATA